MGQRTSRECKWDICSVYDERDKPNALSNIISHNPNTGSLSPPPPLFHLNPIYGSSQIPISRFKNENDSNQLIHLRYLQLPSYHVLILNYVLINWHCFLHASWLHTFLPVSFLKPKQNNENWLANCLSYFLYQKRE